MSIISSMQVKVLSAAIVAVLWSTASPVRAYKALDYEYLHELHNGSSIKSYGDLSPTYSVAYTTRMYNATLHKCRCLGDQVWDGWRCLNTSTIVVVHNPITKHIIAVQTREFGNVETGLPQCAAGEVLALLDSNRGSVQQFSLLDSGYLYWQQRQYEKYCIDHTMDNNGEPLSWEALVCLPPPKVPLCCPQGPGLAPNYSCATHFGQVIIAPPVMVDGVLTDWPAGVNGDIINVTCKGLQELVNLSLNNLEIHLNYQSGNVSLVWSSTNLQGAKQQDFCVSVEEGREDYIVKTCYEDPVASHYTQCSNATCVRKCCPESQLIVGYSCDDAIYESEFWNPTFYDPDSVSQIVPSPSGLKIVYGFPLCENFFVIGDFESENTNISLLNDGYLYASGYKDAYPPDRYCLDKFRIEPSASTQALLCFDDNTEASTCSKVRSYLYPSLLLVSCMFLSLTLAAYASLAELRNKLHGKCLLSLVSSLLIAYILLASIFLTKVNISTGLCRTIDLSPAQANVPETCTTTSTADNTVYSTSTTTSLDSQPFDTPPIHLSTVPANPVSCHYHCKPALYISSEEKEEDDEDSCISSPT
nr:uncharacterized protein LOC128689931 [Cherax quadricarinatus]